MIPAQTTPMQISLARLTASMKTCPFAPPVAPNSSLAMIAAERRCSPWGTQRLLYSCADSRSAMRYQFAHDHLTARQFRGSGRRAIKKGKRPRLQQGACGRLCRGNKILPIGQVDPSPQQFVNPASAATGVIPIAAAPYERMVDANGWTLTAPWASAHGLRPR
jgi:hypothetical protein